jgi:V8-like Glu-specific endopeptidase
MVAGLAWTAQAAAMVIGNANSSAKDYISLATVPGFTRTNSYGTAAYNDAFASVGQVYGMTARGRTVAASGVLIASEWVLTAAHVTLGATSLKIWFDGGGNNFNRPGAIVADRIYTNSYWSGDLLSGYDLGLFHLATPCVGCTTATLAAFNPAIGDIVTGVGFGKTGTGSYGATSFDGLKRAGTNTLDGYLNDGNILLADFDSGKTRDNYTGTTARTALEAIIAPGDSGGGLFDVNGLLVGITSFTWGKDGYANSDYGDVAGWSSVAYFREWIECVVSDSCLPGSITTSDGSTTSARAALVEVPEPAAAGLAMLALSLAALRASRQPRG